MRAPGTTPGTRLATALLALVVPSGAAAAAPGEQAPGEQAPPASYTLTVFAPEGLVVVELRAAGLDPEAQELSLHWARGTTFADVEPLLEGEPRATAEGLGLPLERPDPFTWRVRKGRAAEVSLEWVVPLRHRSLERVVAASDAYEFPYLEEDHGLLVSATLLARPSCAGVPLEASVRVEAPEGWPVLAPWPRDAEGRFRPGPGLCDDLLAIGAWEVSTLALEGFEAVVAVAPRQGELAAAVAGPIRAIVTHELELFGRAPRERYLFLFGQSDVQGFAGSPKRGSMTLAVGAAARGAAAAYVPHLVAHEFFHTWGAASGQSADDLRWLGEGITDWYAYLVLARVGLTDWGALAATLGEKLDELEHNPLCARTSLAEAGGPAFFEGGDAYRLVYAGGLVVGAWLDRALRERYATSLDALLRALWNDPRSAPEREVGLVELLELVERLADASLARELEALVRQPLGRPDSLAARFAAVGAPLERGPDGRWRVDEAPWRSHR